MTISAIMLTGGAFKPFFMGLERRSAEVSADTIKMKLLETEYSQKSSSSELFYV